MEENEQNSLEITRLIDKFDQLQKQKEHERLSAGQPFENFYSNICDRIRSENTLDNLMEEFEKCLDDRSRINYVWKLPEVECLTISSSTSLKDQEEAQTCEDLYDMLVPEETNAARALEVIQTALSKSPPADTQSVSRRLMKRSWCLLLLERFSDAQVDARRSLESNTSPGAFYWNAHEILGHCQAKAKNYKESETSFMKALEGLRKSKCSNNEKAAAAVRISTVLKMVKEESKPKNKAKETANKQKSQRENLKAKKLDEQSSSKVRVESPSLPSLSYGINCKLTNASVALKVVYREGRGRCVVANRDIKTGSVLMVDEPYAAVVNKDQLQIRCFYCCRRSTAGIHCKKCSLIQYCSPECEQLGGQLHQLECAVMNHIYDPSLGKMSPMVFRILSVASWTKIKKSKGKLLEELKKQKKKFEPLPKESPAVDMLDGLGDKKWHWEGPYSEKNYLSTFYLVTNSSKRSFGDLFKRSLTAVYLTHCLKAAGFFGSSVPSTDDLKFISSLALHHLQNTSCNAYEIGETTIKQSSNAPGGPTVEIGGAIYPTISLTNHSCCPNVVRYSVGRRCVLRATRFIPKDDEILDNYGHFFHVTPAVERRDALRTQYKFQCCCEACEQEWPLYPHKHGEPIVFRCPGCLAPSAYMEGSRTTCPECGDSNGYRPLVQEISQKLEMYAQALSLMHRHEFEEALHLLIQLQEFFDPVACLPAKCFTDVQELIRQCYNCLGNVHRK